MGGRHARIAMATVAAASLAACSFTAGVTGLDAQGGGTHDDAPACTNEVTTCSDDVTLTTSCGAAVVATATCPWGCVSTPSPAHCGVLQPSGGAASPGDFLVGAPSLTLGSATVDTENATITMGGNVVATGRMSSAGNGVAVFSLSSLQINDMLTFTGSYAAAFVVTGDITIDGVVDAQSESCLQGSDVTVAGPGGFAGAQQSKNGSGSGSGGQAGGDAGGGGGGGYGGSGGLGGDQNNSNNAGSAGSAWGGVTLATLIGGGGGGAASDNHGGSGGGGGGAIQFVSNTTITIQTGGGINVGGCGGGASDATTGHGGGGGGAGGAILLEAPTLTIAGTLAANGGGGGGGDNNGTVGSAGGLASGAAAGGQGHDGNGDENGGSGAAGSAFVGSAGATGGSHTGGGGGGIGYIRLNSRAGAATVNVSGAVLSPAAVSGSPATVGTGTVK